MTARPPITLHALLEAGAGDVPDHLVARRLGVPRRAVLVARHQHGIEVSNTYAPVVRRRNIVVWYLQHQYQPVGAGDVASWMGGGERLRRRCHRDLEALGEEGRALCVGRGTRGGGKLWVAA